MAILALLHRHIRLHIFCTRTRTHFHIHTGKKAKIHPHVYIKNNGEKIATPIVWFLATGNNRIYPLLSMCMYTQRYALCLYIYMRQKPKLCKLFQSRNHFFPQPRSPSSIWGLPKVITASLLVPVLAPEVQLSSPLLAAPQIFSCS